MDMKLKIFCGNVSSYFGLNKLRIRADMIVVEAACTTSGDGLEISCRQWG